MYTTPLPHRVLVGAVVTAAFFVGSFGSVFADNPTGLEPPTSAYIEAQQGPDRTAYALKSLFNKDWLANARVTWKAHISCGTFSGTTFNPAGCGDLSKIDESNTEMRICVFLEHKNGEILMGSYPERGRKHGFGDALHAPSADELTCFGSTQERAPSPPAQGCSARFLRRSFCFPQGAATSPSHYLYQFLVYWNKKGDGQKLQVVEFTSPQIGETVWRTMFKSFVAGLGETRWTSPQPPVHNPFVKPSYPVQPVADSDVPIYPPPLKSRPGLRRVRHRYAMRL